jgi:hypothetical protein
MAFVEIIGQQPLVEVTPSEPAEVIVTPGGNTRMNVVIVNDVATVVNVTASQGIRGADGAPGPTGPAGPNQVTTSTATNITGILKGNGTNVQQAVAGTDYGTVSSVGITAGTGISVSGTNPITSSGSITVTNSAPDQVVGLSAGTGIGVSGTYPNFTISNTSPSSGGTVTQVNTAGLISGGPITGSGTITTSMATNKLVGRSTAGTGVMEEITIGEGLSLSSGQLTATAQPTGYEQHFLLMGA